MAKKILFLLYNYYNKGATKYIAYGHAVLSFGMLITFNVFTILIITGQAHYILDPLDDISRPQRYLAIGAFYVVPMYFLVSFLLPKRSILQVQLTPQQIRTGGIYLTVYIVVSFALLMTVAIIFHKP